MISLKEKKDRSDQACLGKRKELFFILNLNLNWHTATSLGSVPVSEVFKPPNKQLGSIPSNLGFKLGCEVEAPPNLSFSPDWHFRIVFVHFFTRFFVNSDAFKMEVQIVDLVHLVKSCNAGIDPLT